VIIWGTGGDMVNLGVLDTRHCDACEKERPFNIVLQYRYFGFYYIFNFVTKKKYLLICNVCSRGWELDAGKLEPRLQNAPIPFMRRYGILVLIGAIAGIIAFSFVITAISAASR
jgi:hypothetical protein